MFVRTRFHYGSLRLRKRERGSDVWEFRYYETNPRGKRMRQSVILGEQALYRTEDGARKATQALLMRLKEEASREEMVAPTFGALFDRYIEHELPERLHSEFASVEHSETHSTAPGRSTRKQAEPNGDGTVAALANKSHD